MDPDITVVIVAWGHYATKHLPSAIESVRGQEGVHACVVVVDNANPDPIPARDDLVVIRTEHRLTLGEAKNRGLKHAQSKYVLFLDADDELCPDILRVMAHALDQKPGLVAVAPRIVDRKTGAPYFWPYPWAYRLNARQPTLFRAVEFYRSCFLVNGSLIRTAVAQSTPGYGTAPESAEDWLFGVSLALRGPIALIDEFGLIYEPQPGGVSSQQTRWRRQTRHRSEVRRRLREDPATPALLRLALPLLAVAHQTYALRYLWPQQRRIARLRRAAN